MTMRGQPGRGANRSAWLTEAEAQAPTLVNRYLEPVGSGRAQLGRCLALRESGEVFATGVEIESWRPL